MRCFKECADKVSVEVFDIGNKSVREPHPNDRCFVATYGTAKYCTVILVIRGRENVVLVNEQTTHLLRG